MKKSKIIYVPIIKSKGGERWALSNMLAETRPRVRPLVELHGHKTKEFNEHLDKVCAELLEAWGESRFYLDGIWLHHNEGDPAKLNRIFSRARARGLSAIPVARPSFTPAAFNRLRSIVEEDGRGCLIRVTRKEAVDVSLIAQTVEATGLSLDRLDLLLDYGAHSMELEQDLASVPALAEWRRVIASSGVFPRSVSNFGIGEWEMVQRADWNSWSRGIASGLPRDPIYSDYVTRAPGAPAEGGNPPVHLRYACDDVWAVRVDGRHQDGDAPEMHTICQSLIEQPFFRGELFSAGDMEIVRTANPDEGPGGPMQWLQWCVSHHIEQVADQLAGVAA